MSDDLYPCRPSETVDLHRRHGHCGVAVHTQDGALEQQPAKPQATFLRALHLPHRTANFDMISYRRSHSSSSYGFSLPGEQLVFNGNEEYPAAEGTLAGRSDDLSLHTSRDVRLRRIVSVQWPAGHQDGASSPIPAGLFFATLSSESPSGRPAAFPQHSWRHVYWSLLHVHAPGPRNDSTSRGAPGSDGSPRQARKDHPGPAGTIWSAGGWRSDSGMRLSAPLPSRTLKSSTTPSAAIRGVPSSTSRLSTFSSVSLASHTAVAVASYSGSTNGTASGRVEGCGFRRLTGCAGKRNTGGRSGHGGKVFEENTGFLDASSGGGDHPVESLGM
ncbi:hypothetical protein V8D89_007402 [Ganoderma adspersum]